MKKQLKAIYDSSFESTTSTSGIKEKGLGFFFSKSDGNYDYNQKKDLSNKIIEDIKKIVVVNINKKVIVIENML